MIHFLGLFGFWPLYESNDQAIHRDIFTHALCVDIDALYCVVWRGRMITSELERLVIERKAKGHIPFFVNCTSGTTVQGAFDPIDEIADICQKYKMWLHIDVSYTHWYIFKYIHIIQSRPVCHTVTASTVYHNLRKLNYAVYCTSIKLCTAWSKKNFDDVYENTWINKVTVLF